MGQVGHGGLGPAVVVLAVMVMVLMGILSVFPAAAVVVVQITRGNREAVLAVGSGRPDAGWGLNGRGRRLTEGRVQVLVSAEL